jgi:hypothetical protein
VSTSLQRIAFQACLIDRSSISPFKINNLQSRRLAILPIVIRP